MFTSLPDRPMPWTMDPLTALGGWPQDQPVVMLHSGRLDRRWSRYSLLARPRSTYRFACSPGQVSGGGQSAWLGDDQTHADWWTHRPFDDLRQLLEAQPGLWIGYFSYEINRFIEPRLQRANAGKKTSRKPAPGWPLIELRQCPAYYLHDAMTGQWSMHGEVQAEITDALHGANQDGPKPITGFTHGPIHPRLTRCEHEAAIGRGMDYIAAGDIFQVNLAQQFTCDFEGNSRELYQALAQRSPAWYGAYLELGKARDDPNRALICTSPELFIDLDQAGTVTTRPIKGTRPAAVDPRDLRDSPKDAAELNMIVDLLRNDLGRVCDYGSVRVDQPRTIETHPTIHHGVATITGHLHPSKDIVNLLRATLPGGSITGAPKVRAMQIIDEIEPVRRGPYCGAIGFIHGGLGQTTARLNIAIRTMLCQTDEANRGQVHYSVGGGIVADSNPAAEYQETLDKAAAMTDALNQSVR